MNTQDTHWKQVTKEELEAFVAAYPHPLTKDITHICEPPMLSYNDFSGNKAWPESMVARVSLVTSIAPSESNTYSIRVSAAN